MSKPVTRREFLGTSGKGAAGVAALSAMHTMIRDARAADERFSGVVETIIAREPVVLDRDEAVVRAAVAATAAQTGSDPVVRSDYGWMDSGILVEAGIPCVVLGPTGDGLHTSDEWVDLASVDACVDIFERMAREFAA